MIESVGWTCTLLRELYIAIQDDTPATWSIGGTLSYVGLGALAGAKPAAPVLTEEQQREAFQEQYAALFSISVSSLTDVRPGLEAATLLTLYDFVLANKLFCNRFLTVPSADKGHPAPFSTFISFTSYLYQHAYRTGRATMYSYLSLLVFLVLVEDPTLAKLLCDTSGSVRLCRQRPPYLPLPKHDRPYAAAILDLLTDAVNHNLRKRLDTSFYIFNLTVLSRLLSYLAKSRTKLAHHWAELWRSLLSFVRFLTTYADDLKSLARTTELIQVLVDVLFLALTAGETFLPGPAAYDDLFYKLVESSDALVKLRHIYDISPATDKGSRINTLILVSQHYQELIESQRAKKEHLSPREVGKIIKQGYETLSIEAREGPEKEEGGYREAEYRSVLKRVARVAVADAGNMILR